MDRDFKGVWIPKEIWLDNRLNALDKIILTEIDSLDKGDEGCYASNQYIAEFCKCSISKVSHSISKLIELEYIYVEKFDGRSRVLKSRLANFARQLCKISMADLQKMYATNIYTNINTNTNNNKEINKENELFDYDWINGEE